MRVTEGMRIGSLQQHLQASSRNLSRIYGKMASQRELSRPSEDPVRAGVIMRLTTQMEAPTQKQDAITQTTFVINAASAALSSAENKMTHLKALAVQAANGTLSEEQLAVIAGEVNEMLESLVCDDANARSGNRTVAMSVTGQEAFVATNVLSAVLDFRDHLMNTGGLTPEDLSAALSNDLGAITDAGAEIRLVTGPLAARSAQLDLVSEQTADAMIRLQEIFSEKRDVDMGELAVELDKEEMVYQALFASGRRILSMSLMDYL